MYLLRKRIVNPHLPVDCQLKHLDLTNEPILLYGSELCGFENHLDIFKKKGFENKKEYSTCCHSIWGIRQVSPTNCSKHTLDKVLVKAFN